MLFFIKVFGDIEIGFYVVVLVFVFGDISVISFVFGGGNLGGLMFMWYVNCFKVGCIFFLILFFVLGEVNFIVVGFYLDYFCG